MTNPVYKIVELEDYSYLERIDADGKIWTIPLNESNADYQAYLKSLEDEAAPK